ncbi:MAG: DUF4037 domain-containing protein [Spirochaetes bacterium]|nr:DUF4037 domain-containing protein [Spirochaetota bacterium]
MQRKVEDLAKGLAESIALGNDVRAILLCEASETDVLDPYFSVVLDVYIDSEPRTPEKRKAMYGAIDAFEPSIHHDKDRFLIDGLPVHVEYKKTAFVESAVAVASGGRSVGKDSGTYIFHRIARSRVLFDRSGWIAGIRDSISLLPDSFWNVMRSIYQPKMEHYVSDLVAAAMTGDGFFYYISLGGFLRCAALAILMVNRRFEPSMRAISEVLNGLESLPEGFRGRWDTLVRIDDTAIAHQYEVAQLLATSIVAMTV